VSRRPFVAGNWKMHKTPSETAPFVRELCDGLPAGVDVAVCVPFTGLAEAVAAARGTGLAVYAQNVHQAPQGAFTGEISAAMLIDAGADGVLIGHSERRQYFNETDDAVAEKVAAALDAGLDVILAVGETEPQREAGETHDVLGRQVAAGHGGAGGRPITIAYEPVWAIGTGRTATPAMAQAAHAGIREIIAELYDDDVAEAVRIQYGGSVKPDNAADLFSEDDIDGGLIGGASLAVDDFAAILAAAAS
jgi:triosephosphate isomerase